MQGMSFIGNILWLILGGIISVLGFIILGIVLCLTIIGIPFGLQAFKIAKNYLTPFGKHITAVTHPSLIATIINVIWLLLLGWALLVFQLAVGIILCMTIIGIPFGLQHFKLMPIVAFPFGFSLE